VWALLAVSVALALGASTAHATTVTLGPNPVVDVASSEVCAVTCTTPNEITVVQTAIPGVTTAAPSAGRIKAWRVIGTLGNMGTLKLVVLNTASPNATSTSAPVAATNVAGQPNAVDVPIAAGQSIGLSLCRCLSGGTSVDLATVLGTSYLHFPVGFTATGQTQTGNVGSDGVYQFNADVVLAPIVSNVSPSTGSPAGGTSVTISGQYLDGATGVNFGGVPAAGFTVVSPTAITATSPPGADLSTIDVTVTGPGGTSPSTPSAGFTYRTPDPAQPPDTKISRSKIRSKTRKATFSFEAIGDASGLECALATRRRTLKFKACKSPQSYKRLKDGKYTFAARGMGSAGPDPSPAIKKFKIG
jgi:hypothetical protein